MDRQEMHTSRNKYHRQAQNYRAWFAANSSSSTKNARRIVQRVRRRGRVRLTWLNGKPVYTVGGVPRRGITTSSSSSRRIATSSSSRYARWPCAVGRGTRTHGAYVHRQLDRWMRGRACLHDTRERARTTSQPCWCLVKRVLPALHAGDLIPLATELPVWSARLARCTAVDLVAAHRRTGALVLVELKTSCVPLRENAALRRRYISQLLLTREIFCDAAATSSSHVECLLLEINPHRRGGLLVRANEVVNNNDRQRPRHR